MHDENIGTCRNQADRREIALRIYGSFYTGSIYRVRPDTISSV